MLVTNCKPTFTPYLNLDTSFLKCPFPICAKQDREQVALYYDLYLQLMLHSGLTPREAVYAVRDIEEDSYISKGWKPATEEQFSAHFKLLKHDSVLYSVTVNREIVVNEANHWRLATTHYGQQLYNFIR